ncbi:MAG TPA: bifunctional diaminohydroxyphosphoribosylaminopyrimidine deaminase/5-amino-6-(5-phosphoribosylamino)uracil reductase RibD [Nevskiaceae bacterium]|nr:bifunctional diaminohydroxyphosphoribosylaminopyrimidine deaminase/5-amino-6-(5-phosphoribosylamino)uracil reductase RibD [Nevskiaceae bacterium]
MSAEDRAYMLRALQLAARGKATTHPNPRVGCVIVRDDRIVGEGWHVRAGEPHAEVHALRQAGDAARGATVYVTLEPCSHFGRTPPCADALIAAGVRRVVAALKDPNPHVAGQGLSRLRTAGIEVRVGLCAAAARRLNRGFLSRQTRHRPWLTLKLAMSLDGRTALADGTSQWITGEAARADVHRLRAEAGAVLTSAATVLADDPQLTARLPGITRQPDRVVLDRCGRVPPTARVWAAGVRRFAVLGASVPPALRDALQRLEVEVLTVPEVDGHLALGEVLDRLATAGVNEVFVECGPRLAGAWLETELVDELLVYVAPCLLGDAAQPLAVLPALQRLTQARRWDFVDSVAVGDDLRLRLSPPRATEETD